MPLFRTPTLRRRGRPQVLPGRRHDSAADPGRAGRAGSASSCPTERYNQLCTMHRTATLLLSPTADLVHLCANATVLLQISTPDIAFPWLNAFSYWLFLFDSRILL